MELAPGENVQVGTFLNEIAGVAEFIAKMMSDNENLNTKVENLTIEKEHLKTKVEDLTVQNKNLMKNVADVTNSNEVLNKQVVDLTGDNKKLFQEKEEEMTKRKDTEEELEFVVSKNKEQKERLIECRANELMHLDEISEQLDINEGLKNKGREIAMKAKHKIKGVSKENALLTIENELFNKFEEKRTNDGKSILEDLARLKQMTSQFSFCRKRVSKKELFNRIAYHVKESIMTGCID